MNDSAQAISSNQQVSASLKSSFTASGDTTPVQSDFLTDSQKLDIFDQAINQVGQSQSQPASVASVVDQAWSHAVQASDPLNPPGAGHTTAKESLSGAGIDQQTPDSGTGIQYVEQEKTPEIPVEVESYLQKVEDSADDQLHQVVIADGTLEQADTSYPSRPVIVLPITQDEEDEGEKMSPKFSLRWLVTWSKKIIKMFAGKVVYRQV
jgi:hypothetical protein